MIIFKNKKEIQDFIRDNGIFKNNDELCIKTGENEYKILNDVSINGELISPEKRLMEFIRFNAYPFIDIDITFPIIDVSIFNKYAKRDDEIKEHRAIKVELNNAKSVIKKNFKLIYFEKVKPSESHYSIYNTTNNTLSEYNNNLLTDDEISKRNIFKNKLSFERIIRDNLINQHKQKYDEEMEKFKELNINKNY